MSAICAKGIAGSRKLHTEEMVMWFVMVVRDAISWKATTIISKAIKLSIILWNPSKKKNSDLNISINSTHYFHV